MSFNGMVQRLTTEVPGLPASYATTLLNEALGMIYDAQNWSWQLGVGGWLSPGLLFASIGGGTGPGTSAGTVTFTPYSAKVIGDATASAEWAAYTGNPLFTQLQIRSPFYSLYSIISYDGVSTITLDRPWMEPGGVGQAYMIYQAYFTVPVTDFKRFIAIRDTTNSSPMDFWTKSQTDLAYDDPERTIFDNPVYVVPYEPAQSAGTAIFGNMQFELWPHPLSVFPYSLNYLRRGPLLVNPGDTLPYPLTEEALLWKAKECSYLFKEAQKGEDMLRGSGADWRFLSQAAAAEYEKRIKPIKDRDRDLIDLYFTRYQPDLYANGAPFSNQLGELNIGRF